MQNILNTINAAMLAANFVCTRSESVSDDDEVREEREYTGNAVLHTKGDGFWDAAANIQVNVSSISIVLVKQLDDDNDSVYTWTHIAVTHDCDEDGYMLYTDNGISDALCTLLNTKVEFTEQGMQDEYTLSLELQS